MEWRVGGAAGANNEARKLGHLKLRQPGMKWNDWNNILFTVVYLLIF